MQIRLDHPIELNFYTELEVNFILIGNGGYGHQAYSNLMFQIL